MYTLWCKSNDDTIGIIMEQRSEPSFCGKCGDDNWVSWCNGGPCGGDDTAGNWVEWLVISYDISCGQEKGIWAVNHWREYLVFRWGPFVCQLLTNCETKGLHWARLFWYCIRDGHFRARATTFATSRRNGMSIKYCTLRSLFKWSCKRYKLIQWVIMGATISFTCEPLTLLSSCPTCFT